VNIHAARLGIRLLGGATLLSRGRMNRQIADRWITPIQRVLGVPFQHNRLEAHGTRVVNQKGARETVAEPQDFLDRLYRLERADYPATGPKTPASSQLATVPGGGASGERHR
jgi:hypothetical protein